MADSVPQPHPSQSRNARKKAKKKAKRAAAAHLEQGHSDPVQAPHDENSDSDSDTMGPEPSAEPVGVVDDNVVGEVVANPPTSITSDSIVVVDSTGSTTESTTAAAFEAAPVTEGSEIDNPMIETNSSPESSTSSAPESTADTNISIAEMPSESAVPVADEVRQLKQQLLEEQQKRLEAESELRSLKSASVKSDVVDDVTSPKIKQLEAELELSNSDLIALRARESALKQQVGDLQVEVEVLKEELAEETKRLRIAEVQARRVSVLEKQLAEMQELLDLEQSLTNSKSNSKPNSMPTAVADPVDSGQPVIEPVQSVQPLVDLQGEPKAAEPAVVVVVATKSHEEVSTSSEQMSAIIDKETIPPNDKPKEDAPQKKVTERWAVASSQPAVPQPAVEEKPKTPRKLDIADRWPAVANPASDASDRGQSQHTEEKPKSARKIDLADRWPAGNQSSTSEKEAPERVKTQGKIDLSSRWPAASASSASSQPTKVGPMPREKATTVVKLDAEAVLRAYLDVRDDSTPTNWAAFAHSEDGTRIGVLATGSDGLSGLLKTFKNDNRVYGFLRVITGDALSKRAKFVLIVWAGQELSALRRARAATDKVVLKEVVKEFSVEMSATSMDDVVEEHILAAVRKSGGADYNAGLREAK